MRTIRCCLASLGMLALSAMMACESAPRTNPADADRDRASTEPSQQDRGRKILALESSVARLEQLVEQMRQQQQEQLNQVRDLNQQLAVELTDLKRSLGMEATPIRLKLPEVPDEAAAPAQAGSTEAPAASGFGFFKRLLLLIVLLAAAFIIFKSMRLWHETDEDFEEDESFETDEGMISLAPEARRKAGPADPGAES